MSRQGEMKDKYDKIRELQEQRDRREREAQSQADDLDAILEASREAHGETPLVSASRLSGPGFAAAARKTSAASPEDAYSANFQKSRFASPEAFSRTRGNPTAIPDGSTAAMQQRTVASTAANVATTQAGAREPDFEEAKTTEHTVTMTVKAFAPSKTEVTQVVRRRSQALGNRPRREPPPVAPANLAGPPVADGPAIKLPEPKPLPQLPTSGEDTPIAPEVKRVVFQRPAATPSASRMVTNRPANYGTLPYGTSTRSTADTNPGGMPSRRGAVQEDTSVTTPDGTSPGIVQRVLLGDSTSPGEGDSTAPGMGDNTSPGGPERDTSPGAGDTPAPFERTSPGTYPGADAEEGPSVVHVPAAADESDPFWRDDVDFEAVPVAAHPAEASATVPTPAPKPAAPAAAKPAAPAAKPVAPQPAAAESTENDARYKRVREIDALIARFAADVEVKVGQGRDNTFLRKRSEILPPADRPDARPLDADDDFPDERTQPRHRNIEIRRENTEIIPRRLPPRKRK